MTEDELEALTDAIDRAIAPPMKVAEAIDVLEYLSLHIDGSLDALIEDQRRLGEGR